MGSAVFLAGAASNLGVLSFKGTASTIALRLSWLYLFDRFGSTKYGLEVQPVRVPARTAGKRDCLI